MEYMEILCNIFVTFLETWNFLKYKIYYMLKGNSIKSF